jgi:protein subunit release factor B
MSEPPYATDRETLEREVEMTFVRGSGPGGQHRNKAETGVRLVHPPSGATVTATERRSQHQNRELAYERLADKLKALNYVPKPRKPTKKPRSADRKRLNEKSQRSDVKKDRKPPRDD